MCSLTRKIFREPLKIYVDILLHKNTGKKISSDMNPLPVRNGTSLSPVGPPVHTHAVDPRGRDWSAWARIGEAQGVINIHIPHLHHRLGSNPDLQRNPALGESLDSD